MVLIVDNLDRIAPVYYKDKTDRSNHSEIFIDRFEQLKGLKCHVIYTVPISLVYSMQGTQLQKCYDNITILPMVAIRKRGKTRRANPDGLQVFHKLLEKRVQTVANLSMTDVFHDKNLVKDLCLVSGGHLRDLIHLVQGTLRYLPQFNDINQATSRSITGMREIYINALNNEDWMRLAQVYTNQEMPNEQDYRNLLFNQGILEYREMNNGKKNPKWQDVHPLILEIEQFKRALELLKKEDSSNA